MRRRQRRDREKANRPGSGGAGRSGRRRFVGVPAGWAVRLLHQERPLHDDGWLRRRGLRLPEEGRRILRKLRVVQLARTRRAGCRPGGSFRVPVAVWPEQCGSLADLANAFGRQELGQVNSGLARKTKAQRERKLGATSLEMADRRAIAAQPPPKLGARYGRHLRLAPTLDQASAGDLPRASGSSAHAGTHTRRILPSAQPLPLGETFSLPK